MASLRPYDTRHSGNALQEGANDHSHFGYVLCFCGRKREEHPKRRTLTWSGIHLHATVVCCDERSDD
jgi:hypothetical protein